MARSSKWAFLAYPDSAPKDWKNILNNTCIPIAISPIHQPDKNGTEEEKKKKHWHIILDFGKQQKSNEQVNEISKSVNGTKAFIIQSPIGYYEYLIHKNDSEKEQFKEGFEAITHMNGFDLETYQNINKDKHEEDAKCISLIEIIRTEGFTELQQLTDYCYDNDMELLGELKRYGYFYNSYIRSRRGMK